MQWLNTLAGWQWAILALVPPAIIALYFLKLKRRPLVVPSTYLWRKSIEDLHVNSLWQRMRRNLLLLLQLIAVALLMLALLRPAFSGRQLAGQRLIFLVDNSASMNAVDIEPTRLDEAKRRVAELIDEMAWNQQAMLISFANDAHVVQGWTSSRQELRRGLDSIRPSQRATNIDDALKVAVGSASSMLDNQAAEQLEATLYIFSDGKFPDVQNFSLGTLNPVFVPLGDSQAANVAIAAFGVRPEEERPERLQAFARLENHGAAPLESEVELYVDDRPEPIDASHVSLEAEGATGLVFELGEMESGILRLKVTQTDALAADNQAWAAVNRARRAKVLLVTDGNEELQRALTTRKAAQLADIGLANPSVLQSDQHRQQAAAGQWDLIIYDGHLPTEPPQANTLYIGVTPQGWTSGEPVTLPAILDVDRAHPLMQHIDMEEVDIVSAAPLKPPPGSTRLIDSTAGPIMAIGPREGFEDAVLGFGLTNAGEGGKVMPNTTWAIRQDFPVFVLNVLEYLGGGRDPLFAGTTLPGRPITLRSSDPAHQLAVRLPDGETQNAVQGRMNTFQFSGTEQLGVYSVEEDGQEAQRFTVSLFDSKESNIRPLPEASLKIGHVKVEGGTAWTMGRRETWKWILLSVLAVLLGEWYIYNRRVYL